MFSIIRQMQQKYVKHTKNTNGFLNSWWEFLSFSKMILDACAEQSMRSEHSGSAAAKLKVLYREPLTSPSICTETVFSCSSSTHFPSIVTLLDNQAVAAFTVNFIDLE